jgi:solute carrier family 25 carnitine/acylcarnitine transporter 20/29
LPIDVGKSRFQTAPEGKYKSLFEVYVELIKKDGIRAFYKGFTPVILRYSIFYDVKLSSFRYLT